MELIVQKFSLLKYVNMASTWITTKNRFVHSYCLHFWTPPRNKKLAVVHLSAAIKFISCCETIDARWNFQQLWRLCLESPFHTFSFHIIIWNGTMMWAIWTYFTTVFQTYWKLLTIFLSWFKALVLEIPSFTPWLFVQYKRSNLIFSRS